jgi:shikimate dehydrogenase
MLGVIGWPIAHSFSPAMHNAALAALGLDWAYGAFPVAPAKLAEAVAGAGALGFVGLNVTIPHKEAALALCRPDEEALRAGAVNTLVFDEAERPRGLNTDLHGFRKLLEELSFDPRDARVAVLGAGGAARAVVAVLADAGAVVTVVTRSARRRIELSGHDVPHLPWRPEVLHDLLPAIDLLVDATPRSLQPGARDANEVDELPPSATVVDLVVRADTPLVAAARARGLVTATGVAMLVHQGARALEAWTGQPAPLEMMRRALDEALAQ